MLISSLRILQAIGAPRDWTWDRVKALGDDDYKDDQYLFSIIPTHVTVLSLMEAWEGMPGSARIPLHMMVARWGVQWAHDRPKWGNCVKVLHLIIAISRSLGRINQAGAAAVSAWYDRLYQAEGTRDAYNWTSFSRTTCTDLCTRAVEKLKEEYRLMKKPYPKPGRDHLPRQAETTKEFHAKLYKLWSNENAGMSELASLIAHQFGARESGLPHERITHPSLCDEIK